MEGKMWSKFVPSMSLIWLLSIVFVFLGVLTHYYPFPFCCDLHVQVCIRDIFLPAKLQRLLLSDFAKSC